ncbi:MAG TPA: PilN domain-containing protein [Thermoanaerobaculia bacterium]|nr:PilN domain-containing protein [Thermoanaerobaculia bacterium]
MIKINLVREGRAVRGAGAAPVAATSVPGAGGRSINNILVVGLLIVGVAAAALYWLWNKRELTQRQETVEQRTAEAQKLESIIKEVGDYQKRKDSLQQRIDLINQLKQNQKGPVRIMDQISRDLPDLVWLDKMTITSGNIAINGRGLNENAIANFVENIKKDPYFEEPALGQLTKVSDAPKVFTFDLSFNFTYTPKAAAGGTGAAVTDTAGATSTTGSAPPAR